MTNSRDVAHADRRSIVARFIDDSCRRTPAPSQDRKRYTARESREDRERTSEGVSVADTFRRPVTDLLKKNGPPVGGPCEAFSKRCVEIPLFVDWDHDVRPGCAGEHQPRPSVAADRFVALTAVRDAN